MVGSVCHNLMSLEHLGSVVFDGSGVQDDGREKFDVRRGDVGYSH